MHNRKEPGGSPFLVGSSFLILPSGSHSMTASFVIRPSSSLCTLVLSGSECCVGLMTDQREQTRHSSVPIFWQYEQFDNRSLEKLRWPSGRY